MGRHLPMFWRAGGGWGTVLILWAGLVPLGSAQSLSTDRTWTTTVSALVGGPSLTHIAFSQPVRADYPIVLTLSANGTESPILSAVLVYRSSKDSSFRSVPLSPAPTGRVGAYTGSAEIPPLSSGAGGETYEYFFNVSFLFEGSILLTQWQSATGKNGFVSAVSSVTKAVGTKEAVVSLSDGNVATADSRVTVPPGAVVANSLVTLGVMTSPAARAALDVPSNGRWPISGLFLASSPNSVFQKPVALFFSYRDADSNGREDFTGADETALQPAWFDGLHWRALPRRNVDSAQNGVLFETRMAGFFALFPSGSLAAPLRPQEKIVSPNGDGINDVALFDGLSSGARVVVFDVRGRLVREIVDAPVWDGTDQDGKVVESGLYVYQVHSTGGLQSGTITVVR